jgi:hypothetical protein
MHLSDQIHARCTDIDAVADLSVEPRSCRIPIPPPLRALRSPYFRIFDPVLTILWLRSLAGHHCSKSCAGLLPVMVFAQTWSSFRKKFERWQLNRLTHISSIIIITAALYQYEQSTQAPAACIWILFVTSRHFGNLCHASVRLILLNIPSHEDGKIAV